MFATLTLAAAVLVGGCGKSSSGGEGYEAPQAHVAKQKIGYAADHWIEMKNMSGQWERTGLIFGYLDDYDECEKAIAGLKQENSAREYRCVPANE